MMNPIAIIDLSHPLRESMPCYPGDPEFKMSLACCFHMPGTTNQLDSDMAVCVHALSLGTHTGTHVDAPFHFFPSGQKLHEVPLAQFVGRAVVLDVRHLVGDRKKISWADMTNEGPGRDAIMAGLSRIGARTEGKADIVLLWTGWDVHWGKTRYFEHPYFSREVATALHELGAKIVGVDVLSPDETPSDEHAVNAEGWGMHETLLSHGILICENLTRVGELSCAGKDRREETWVSLTPLGVHDADGAPVRAYGWTQLAA